MNTINQFYISKSVFITLVSLCFFVNANAQESFSFKDSKEVTKASVKALCTKVADWQIETFEDQGKYRALPTKDLRKWHHRRRYSDLTWNNGALYAGMHEWSLLAEDDKYKEWLLAIGNKNDWQLNVRKKKGVTHADAHAVGISHLKMYEQFGDAKMIAPTEKAFDEILSVSAADEYHWNWADALFMSPTVWVQLFRVTEDKRYLNYMDAQYHKTYENLWNAEDQLFWRDNARKKKSEKNGANEYWARGNGWAFGGLTYMLPYFPEAWKGRPFYVKLFQDMAEALKRTQRSDGTWSMGMMGAEKDYPSKDISGSTFFVFGLARGINMGILDRATYEPVLYKGWQALTKCVREDGLVGYVQGVGAGPGETFKDYTETYGVGGFLAAGAEVYKLLGGESPAVKHANTKVTTFMKDGGWCWFQDPRVIINNEKLVIGGVSGAKGDVRVGVYDLKKEKALGVKVLHEKLEKDDHNNPAFYVRPDGRILAMYAKHARENSHYYSLSDADDYLQWEEPKQFIHNYEDKKGVTYMNLYTNNNEGLLYNFFRDGPTFNPWFVTSADHGNTWGNRTHFIADELKGRARPYARYLQRDENTIGVSFTDAHPRNFGNSIYYTDFKNGSFYKANGTKIKDLKDGALKPSEAEQIYVGGMQKSTKTENDSAENSAWTSSMAKDKNNHPHIGYSTYVNNNDHRYRLASWNGKQWIDKEIAYAGDKLYRRESSYTGLVTLDPDDPTQVYISTDVNPKTGEDLGGKHEIYTAKIKEKDDIHTINWKPITSNSKYSNLRPIVVSNEGYKVLLWMYGPWTTNTMYKPDIVGVKLGNPK